MKQNDIRDNRSVQREMDINHVTAQSVEKLLRFIGLLEGEISLKDMDAILNAQRIENAGQKPQGKLKKIMLPQRKLKLVYL